MNPAAEPWSVRVQRLMHALGWPPKLMALELGMKSDCGVTRILKGGRPSMDVLLRLQTLEKRHEGEIEKQRRCPSRRVREAYQWPPAWVKSGIRWWVRRDEDKPAARPEDLAMLGASRTDPAVVLTGRNDPRFYPGRVPKIVDWTPAGRARYAENCELAARRRAEDRKAGKRIVVGGPTQGKTEEVNAAERNQTAEVPALRSGEAAGRERRADLQHVSPDGADELRGDVLRER